MEHQQILAFTNKESVCLPGNFPPMRNKVPKLFPSLTLQIALYKISTVRYENYKVMHALCNF